MIAHLTPTVQNEAAAQAVLDAAKAEALQTRWATAWIDLPKLPMQGSSGYHAIALWMGDDGWHFDHVMNRTGFQRYEEPITEDEAVTLLMLAFAPAVSEVRA